MFKDIISVYAENNGLSNNCVGVVFSIYIIQLEPSQVVRTGVDQPCDSPPLHQSQSVVTEESRTSVLSLSLPSPDSLTFPGSP